MTAPPLMPRSNACVRWWTWAGTFPVLTTACPSRRAGRMYSITASRCVKFSDERVTEQSFSIFVSTRFPMKFENGHWQLQPDTRAVFATAVADVKIEPDALVV